jgi:DNA-binding transcriptional ArsR family regulator
MDIFNALSVDKRRKIVEMLASDGQLAATAIAGKFQVSPPAISQHLKILRQANLVSMEKRGQQRLYTINPGKVEELEYWAERVTRQWEERFNKLDAVLASEKDKILKMYNAKTKKKG